MKKNKKGVLILTPFFSPNVGGVETHLDDLVRGLDKRKYKVFVQTYSPITTDGVKWEPFEKKGNSVEIRRYMWFGKNLFHKIEKFPFVDFLYITPYLFLRTFVWLLSNHKKVDVIHAQGFNAAWMGKIFKKLFKKRLVVSTHAVYEIDKESLTAKWIVKILNEADKVLCVSTKSKEQLVSFGLDSEKISVYKHWVDLELFNVLDKHGVRRKLGFEEKFSVIFVGRWIEKKGIRVLSEVALDLPDINFIFVGSGPEEVYLKEISKKSENIKIVGFVKNDLVFKYLNSADLFCIPSQYEEAFGRVIMEAVACGLPVVGSNKGGIPEALDESVSVLVEPTGENLKRAIGDLFGNKEKYMNLKNNCRDYAEKNFSEENINLITKYY